MSLRSISAAILRLAWSGVSRPVKAVVDRSYARQGAEGGYAADLEVVHRVTLKRTGETLPGVPLQPVWLGPDGRGLYAPPAPGQLVIVNWIEGDRAHPYVAGAAADAYAPAVDAAVGALVLSDGGRNYTMRVEDTLWALYDASGAQIRLRGSRWTMVSDAESLRTILDDLIDALIALTTTQGPATAVHDHAASAATIAALQAVKQRLPLLFEG